MDKEELFKRIAEVLIDYERNQGEFTAVGCGINLYADNIYTWCGHGFFVSPLDECEECKE